MKKRGTLLLLFLLPVLFLHSQTIVIDGKSYVVDTLKNHPVGPGTQYTSIRLTADDRLDVFFLKVETTNPYVTFKSALGHDSIYTGETPSSLARRSSKEGAFYFAGTNGDFYETTGYVGYPVGGQMGDSEIAKTPTARNVFAIDENKIPEIGLMTYSGNVKFGTSTWTINSANHLRANNRLVLFNHHNGKYTHTDASGTEVLVELLPGNTWGVNKTIRAKVTKVEKNIGNMAIPNGQAVLSGQGTQATNLNNLNVNDEIDITLNLVMNGQNTSAFTQMTAGDNYATMLKDGVVETANIWNELHPRTALGYSQSKDTLIFCVVDGRGLSAGVTTKQLAQLMKSAGAYTAFNMDGGGSSCMYIEPYGGPVNAVSDGNERAVATSIFVVSTAPTDPVIGKLIPYQPNIILPRYGEHIPQFYAYNQYGVMLDMDLKNFTLSCSPELGTIEGNKFIATGTQPGDITATNGTATTKIHVSFIPVTAMSLLLDSVILDNRKNYSVEVLATSGGSTLPLSPVALSWTVKDTDICTVEDGVLKAVKNGTTIVTGTLGALKDSLKVIVEIPTATRKIMDTFVVGEWTGAASSQLSATYNTNNLPSNWEHGLAANFTYKAGLGPYINLTNKNIHTYAMPDTIIVVMNAGNVAISRVMVYLRANNDTKTVSKELRPTQKNSDIELVIPVNDLLNSLDHAVYPIYFNNIYFYLSAMTVNQSYTLSLKEIIQAYSGTFETGIKHPQTVDFSVYPNPVTGDQIEIRLNDTREQAVRIEIYTLSGQKVQAEQLGVRSGGVVSFTKKNLPTGIYLLKVYRDGKADTVKLIIK